MVSFCCEVCQDTIKKPKLDAHRNSCRGAHFTCLDCNKTFRGIEYRTHTSCITEAERYEKKGRGNQSRQVSNQEKPKFEHRTERAPQQNQRLIKNPTESKAKEALPGFLDSNSITKTPTHLYSLLKKESKSIEKKARKSWRKNILKKLQVHRRPDGTLCLTI